MFKDHHWEQEFQDRLSTCFDEMKWLYGELYNNDEQAFTYFLEMLHNSYVARKEELRKSDREKEANPSWYRDTKMLGMQLYADNFAGDLQGVREHLDYIEECGVNYLHLMPLLVSPRERSDGGYAVADFRKVEPSLGTMDDLADLADACHARKMGVCLDFVMNHTSEDHEWARRARAGEKEYQDRYFFFDDWEIPNQFEATMPQVFPKTAPGNFTWNDETQKVVMTTFYPYQWDLNYRNPTVFNDMTENMLFLCNHGVDIIRLDAVPYIWKTLGTNCRNLPQVHTVIRIMRMAVEVVCPGTLLLGEVVMEPSRVVPYFGTEEKPECHMLYNVTTMASTWNSIATKDVRLLRHQMEQVFSLPREDTFLNYLRCHDDIGWGLDYGFLSQFGVQEVAHKKFLNDYFRGAYYGSESRGELYNDDPSLGDARLCGTTASLCGIESAEYESNDVKLAKGIRLDLMLHAFLLTQSGIPVLYSGDEIGMCNDYSYHKDPAKADDSRYLHRGRFNREEAALRHDPTSRQGLMFHELRRLETIRNTYDVFDNQADLWVIETWNDHVLGIGRYYQGQKMLALFNFSEFDQTAWIKEVEDYYDMMTGLKRPAKAVAVPGYGFVWLITSFRDEAIQAKAPARKTPARKTTRSKGKASTNKK